jgi:phospholipase/carboxylesterase
VKDFEAIISLLVKVLMALEDVSRRLHPFAVPQLKEGLLVYVQPLETSRQELLDRAHTTSGEHALQQLLCGCELVLDSIKIFGTGGDTIQAFMAVLRAFRKSCQAQDALFELRHDYQEINRYFLDPAIGRVAMPDWQTEHEGTGIIHSGLEQNPYARGGYSLYVPETYGQDRAWPLVVALHGGYGHGRDFLWTWLREARSRGFVLLAPTSLGQTWSISHIEVDAEQLIRHVEEVCTRFTIDRGRILMTGMSDGGTFGLSFGLQQNSPAKAIAPVSCVLAQGEMAHAGDRRIYWVHGAQDWMFPVSRAVNACKDLSLAGADVRLKVVPDLSHAYPREENDAILRWFDPSLANEKPS